MDELVLWFPTIKEACAYAKANGIADKDQFRFIVGAEPNIIFTSIFEYFYEG